MIIVHVRTEEENFLKHTFAHAPDAYTPQYAWDNDSELFYLYSDADCTKAIPGTFLKCHFDEVRRFHDKIR